MEPHKPVVPREVREMGSDDVEGPIHHTISHSRLEIGDLSKYHMRGFIRRAVYMLQVHHEEC